MHEITVNLHVHTPYSDGHYTHARIAQAAMRCGLDAVIVADHNVWVDGPEGYYQDGDKRVLMLVGEEIHDQSRNPQKNHLLVVGAGRELANLAPEPQRLLDTVRKSNSLAFLAHPVDLAAPAVGEGDISWVDWDLQGFHGIELWNGFSEFKGRLKTMLHAIYFVFNPRRIARGPYPQAIRKWDELLNQGNRIVAIGSSDAHALPTHLGPFRRTVFPYEFHFRGINTHLLLNEPLTRDIYRDRRMILDALREGHAFIGYDLPARTDGFRFRAQGVDGMVNMGEEINGRDGVTLQIRLPVVSECRLLHNGKAIKIWRNRENCTYITSEPGVYRVEVYIHYLGQMRGWIFSNPIYVR